MLRVNVGVGVESIEMASQKSLLGGIPHHKPLRVGIWNGEDPQEELDRRIEAICRYYNISDDDLGDRLYQS
jgi:hypothetical protein